MQIYHMVHVQITSVKNIYEQLHTILLIELLFYVYAGWRS